ncbi:MULTISPECIES: alpha/beta hydrolase [unclassified Paenibacillus]|uniref:alpha/beta hydrolase n=1 Tax=unclassified Paenibacillus TaxID=185978 RepID=UPI0011AFD3D0|nr:MULTISPECIES: alpha/beta hydrolase [unclassified Paenibacillus]
METKRTGAKGFKRKRYWIPSVVLILIIGFIGVGTQWTPKITVFLLKSLIETANPDMNNKDTMLSDGITRVVDVLYADEGRNDSTLDIYYPSVTSEPLPVVLWVHGGGWVLGDKADITEYAVQLAKQGYVVVSMNYALAPDTTYPTPVIQTNQALMYVKNHVSEYQGDPDNIFLAGNSAGAQIASQTAAVVTNPSLAKLMNITRVAQPDDLRGVLLFCGPYNLSTVAETGFPLIRTFLWSYTGVKTFEDYPRLNEMSTVLQVTAAYPPAFITSGNVDPLTSQSIELAQVLKRLDVDTETLFFSNSSEKLGHDYQFDLKSDAGQQAIRSAVRFMQQYSR